MNSSAVDLPAFLVALAAAVVIAATLIVAQRGGTRRAWIAAAALAALLMVVAILDISRTTPRETHISTVVTGVLLSVLGALGIVFGTKRVNPWLRWPLAIVTALVLLMGGLLVGAAVTSRVLPY